MSEQTIGNSSDKPATASSHIKRWGLLAVLLSGIAGIYISGLHEYLSLASIVENRDALMAFVSSNFLTAIVSFVVVYVIAVALSLPGATLLTLLGGFLFGWAIGGAVTVLAATCGAIIIFMAAKTSFGDALASKAGPWMEKLSKGFQEDGFNYMLFLRLVPVFPFWLVNIAPALAGVKLRTYAIATSLGIIPGTFAFSLAGSSLDSIIDAQKAKHEACIAANGAENCTFSLDVGALVTPQLLAAFAALGVVALIPVVVKKLRKSKTDNPGSA